VIKRRTLFGVACLLALALMGIARVSAAEKFDTDPKQQIPKPDGKEADMSKPVQVFILMGQSNMVGRYPDGFGPLPGAENDG